MFPRQSQLASFGMAALYSSACVGSTGQVINTMHQHEFIHGLAGIKPHHRGCVATIGSFDGVHLGHQAILARLLSVAQERGLPAVAILFEPQPLEYFKQQPPARLMRLREKVEALFAAGAQRVVCLKFDNHLRGLTGQEFIEQVLVDKLAVGHLEIGDDFRFGCGRSGDFALLEQAGKQHQFTVTKANTLVMGTERVSSTRIRHLLEQDQLEAAADLLGAPYSMTGRVVYGKQLGRSIGVPTANVALGRHRRPLTGVYAVEATHRNGGQRQFGVANVGTRPTVDGGAKPVLEVHLFDFDGDLYGECLQVTFKAKLRNEQKFETLEQLKDQIQNDIEHSKQFFGGDPGLIS